MPIESGPYCQHCADDSGNLQAFDERFARMIQWTRRENPALDQATAEQQTLQYMATMPAWKDLLADQQIRDVVSYIKTFSEKFKQFDPDSSLIFSYLNLKFELIKKY